MKPIRTLIVEDEWLIRTELKSLLKPHSRIEIVGEAMNLDGGVRALNDLKPDLLFLDLQLPGGTGFDLLDRVTGDFKVVFITAYDQIMKRVKRYHPIDTLMKPIGRDPLEKAIQKALREISREKVDGQG